VLRVFNKIDRLEGGGHSRSGPDEIGDIWLSAVTGDGIDGLKTAIQRRLGGGSDSSAIDF
jgi:50S ribosomal subunit-associated GTPase HflX